MRVAGDRTLNLLAALNRTQSEQEKALQQLSTGTRINAASDDPAGMADWLSIRSETTRDDEFLHSISSVTSVLQTADSTLNSVVIGLQRAIDLGVRGSTSTLSESDRKQIAEEVSGILSNTSRLANVNVRGTYLFAGTDVLKEPFQPDAGSSSGWSYNGNSNSTAVEIGACRTVRTNVPGDKIFMADGANVFQSLADLVSALQANDAESVRRATQDVRAAFDHISCERVFYGNAVSQLEMQTDTLKAEQLQLASQENDVAGTDPAESISRFLNAQTAREAALAAAGKVSNLSLLDYLR